MRETRLTVEVRAYVAGLLDAWQSGARRPPDVFADARSSWLFGGWPRSFERGYDAIGMEVLYVLATARDMGLDDDDIHALRDYLSATDQAKAQEQFVAHWEAAGRDAREAAGLREDYYGPPPSDLVEESELTLTDPEDRRLHQLVRTDPESAWADLRARLCEPPPRDELFLLDLVEDLMFNDPDSFIGRVEALVAECPEAREPVAFAHIGGRASSPGLERFWALQERLGGE
jgi:hypothetical protein